MGRKREHWPGKALAEFRKNNGLTMAGLGELLGLPVGALMAYGTKEGQKKGQRRTPALDRAALIEIKTAGKVPISCWLRAGNATMLRTNDRPDQPWKGGEKSKTIKVAVDKVIATGGDVQIGDFLDEATAAQLRGCCTDAKAQDLEWRLQQIRKAAKDQRRKRARKNAVVSMAQRADMARRHNAGEATLRALAEEYGVSNPTVLRHVTAYNAEHGIKT